MKKSLGVPTLIDLPVVISVIAPSVFSRFQEKARITQGLNNPRLSGIATQTCADLHSEGLSWTTFRMATTGRVHDSTRFHWEP